MIFWSKKLGLYLSFYSGTPKFCLGLLLFLLEESRTPVFKILVRSLVRSTHWYSIVSRGKFAVPTGTL